MNPKVITAIFKRDFVSYFSNPTGYVFISVFVVLSAWSTFAPAEFFSNNLANLDQLSQRMPFILIIFIPAITMGIWAEERRQGTDELLLTLPASDFDVVLGKYKAAVAIFTVALAFSAFSIYLVFMYGLGSPDLGQFLSTFLGYWLVGLAMLAIGMVASFLTSNLTVGFIFGMLFNLPLALAGIAGAVIKQPAVAEVIRAWSAVEQFEVFSRGVLTLSGLVYFVGIALVMLYVSMILISSRHWFGSDTGMGQAIHYLMRTLCLLAVVFAVNSLLTNFSWIRTDVTEDGLNSIAEASKDLIRKLASDNDAKPVKVEVFVSPRVPTEFTQQRRELLSTLTELESLSGGKVQVNVNQIEVYSPLATIAEQAHGIEPRQVVTTIERAKSNEEIFLGAAFTCGLDKVVVPFFDLGVPVEYELVRSIATVSQQERKKIGVLKTDAPLMGGFSMQGPREEAMIITELKKQYDVVEVDPATPITEDFDVLLAVQPSSLSPEAMVNFVDVVRGGQPVAIFEDPFAALMPGVPGTSEPKMAGGQMGGMFGGGRPEPKGDMNQLWDLLGVRMDGEQIVWQNWNPYRGANYVTLQWVFVDQENGALSPFSPEDEISSGMQQVLFFLSGGLQNMGREDVNFVNLAVTGDETGTVPFSVMRQVGGDTGMTPFHNPTGKSYIIAAHVSGKVVEDAKLEINQNITDDELANAQKAMESDGGDAPDPGNPADEAKEKKEAPKFNAVVVADLDCLSDTFINLRRMSSEELQEMFGVEWRFQNVSFVLNILDSLANDERFIPIRKRSRNYRTLTQIEQQTADSRETAQAEQEEFQKKAKDQIAAAREEFNKKLDQIRGRTDISEAEKRSLVQVESARLERIRDVKIKRLEDERDLQVRKSERLLAANVRGVQFSYKLAAVLVPPVLPILLALLVFLHRRAQEKEGVSQSRLRYGGPAKKVA